MSDRQAFWLIVAAFAAFSLLVLVVMFQRNGAERDRDIWHARADAMTLRIVRGCVAHPDGSGTCKPGTLVFVAPVMP